MKRMQHSPDLSVVNVCVRQDPDPDSEQGHQRVHEIIANQPLWNEAGVPLRGAVTLERVLQPFGLVCRIQPQALPSAPDRLDTIQFMHNDARFAGTTLTKKDLHTILDEDVQLPQVRLRWHDNLPGMLMAHRDLIIGTLALEAVRGIVGVENAQLVKPADASDLVAMYEHNRLLSVLAQPMADMESVQLQVYKTLTC